MGRPLSGAQHWTGSMQFMAIGALYGHWHTYRHDLEPVFYVFLWACIRFGDAHFVTSLAVQMVRIMGNNAGANTCGGEVSRSGRGARAGEDELALLKALSDGYLQI
ncbi:MAG: hypothetical protein M1826_003514 [Phylliscum demangeonii]|nr:MAG: hypothetical protein M1826_003514 [Phylliscum demangeonii]